MTFVLDAQRKLGFLGQEGFDIFGKNALFTPLVKWETLQEDVNEIKAAAETYEQAFNDMMEEETNNNNFQEVSHQYAFFYLRCYLAIGNFKRATKLSVESDLIRRLIKRLIVTCSHRFSRS